MSDLADLLIHPVRLRIVQTLVGRELTAAELRTHLPDVPQATLYRHLGRLHDGGLIAVVQERPVRGVVERTFTAIESAVSLSGRDVAGASMEQLRTYLATFLTAILAQFDRYLEADDVDLEADGVSFRQVPVCLTDDEFRALLAEVRAPLAARLGNEPGPGRRRRMISVVTMPEPT